MPTYVYKCDLGHQHEDVRLISERHFPATCPTCGTSVSKMVPVTFALAPENTTPTGKRVWETGMDKDAAQITTYRQEAELKGIHECVVESNREVNDLGRVSA